MFFVTVSSTEFAARELCQRCDVLASKQPSMLFFRNGHSIGSMAYKPAVYVVYMQNQTLTAPPLITASV